MVLFCISCSVSHCIEDQSPDALSFKCQFLNPKIACFDATSMPKSALLREQKFLVWVFFGFKILICNIKINDERNVTSFEGYLEL